MNAVSTDTGPTHWVDIDSADAAQRLGEHLLDPSRTQPAVLVTVQAGRRTPLVDADRVASELSGYAETYVMPTGAPSWGLAQALRGYPGTECYGGACRVYPPGLEWTTDLSRSPLRFVFTADDAERVGTQIISDALEMAFRSGTATLTSPLTSRRASGQVQGTVSGRALVQLDDGGFATIWPELTAPGVATEHLLRPGMTVTGRLDPDTRRLDVTGMLIDAADALSGYEVGAQLPARVVAVESELCVLEVFPDFCCTVAAEAVVETRLAVDLRQWLSEGETVVTRILGRGASEDDWTMSLLEVDPNTPVQPAPALLNGGPPWLLLPHLEPGSADPIPQASDTLEDTTSATGPTEPTPLEDARPDAAARAELSTTGSTTEAVSRPAGSPAPSVPDLAVDDQLSDVSAERDALARQLRRSQEILAARETDLQTLRTRSRQTQAELARAIKMAAGLDDVLRDHDADQRAFTDPERQLRYEVDLAWARRIPAAEKDDLPLRPWILGPDFLSTLASTAGVDRGKVIDVIVDIATGRIHKVAGRQTHQLRTTDAASAPYRTRPDGATCWRVSLQHKSPQARRLHYWQRPDGTPELSSVRLHDDPRP